MVHVAVRRTQVTHACSCSSTLLPYASHTLHRTTHTRSDPGASFTLSIHCLAIPPPGDGAGCLVAMPHDFLKTMVKKDCSVDLPEPEEYGVGMCFLPNADKELYAKAKSIITKVAEQLGHEVLGWRSVPTDSTGIGPSALATQPIVEQIFLGNSCQETYCHTDAEQQVSSRVVLSPCNLFPGSA